MKKICKVCNDEFTDEKYRIYCSSKCKHGGVFYPTKKKYKHKLNDVSSQSWSHTVLKY